MRYGASHHTGGHWTLGSWCTEHGEYKHCRMVPTPLNTAHPAVALHLLQTSCHHHAHQCSDTGDTQQTVSCYCRMDLGLGACLWQSAVLLSPVVSLLLYCLTLPLRLATNRATPVQRGDWRQARWVRGCRGLALRMSPDRPGAVPMWQLWAGKVCQDTATITFIDHSRSNKFASVITGRLCTN